MSGNLGTPGASVTARALSLLAAFDGAHRALNLTELAARADLPIPTVHRLALALSDWGALERRPDGKYVVGRRLWSVGLLAPVETGLRELASPYLHDLYGATLATVHLAVRDDLASLYIDVLAGHSSVRVVSRAGDRLPLHSTGVGKVLLANAPSETREQVLGRLQRFTPYTIIQPGILERQLDNAVRDGYATTAEEMTLGACSIAVPVTRAGGEPAALGVVVPSLKDQSRLVNLVQGAAEGIGRALERSLAHGTDDWAGAMGMIPGAERSGPIPSSVQWK